MKTNIIILLLFIISIEQGYIIYQNQIEITHLTTQSKEIVKLTTPEDINKTGFFSNMYLKTKSLFE